MNVTEDDIKRSSDVSNQERKEAEENSKFVPTEKETVMPAITMDNNKAIVNDQTNAASDAITINDQTNAVSDAITTDNKSDITSKAIATTDSEITNANDGNIKVKQGMFGSITEWLKKKSKVGVGVKGGKRRSRKNKKSRKSRKNNKKSRKSRRN